MSKLTISHTPSDQSALHPLSSGSELMREVLDQLNLVWITIDTNGKITEVSKNFSVILGDPQINLKDDEIDRYVHPEDKEKLIPDAASLLHGKTYPVECRFSLNQDVYTAFVGYGEVQKADEEIHTRHFLLYDKESGPGGENYEKIIHLVRHIPMMIMGLDGNSTIRFWNHECERITEFPAEMVVGKEKILEKLFPDIDSFRQMVVAGEGKHPTRNKLIPMRTREGEGKLIRWTIVSAPWPVGEVYQWAVGADVTSAFRKKQKIIEQENLFRSMFALSHDGLILTDISGTIFEINPAALEMLGFTDKSEAEGVNVFDKMEWTPPFHRQPGHYPYDLTAITETGRIENHGQQRNIEIFIDPVYDHDANPWYLAIRLKDITDKIAEEHKIKASLEEEERTNRLKSAFLSNMTHEIRTPLNAIVGFANLLAHEEITDAERKEYIEYIEYSSDILLQLVNDILDISKIEAGKMVMHKHPFMLGDFLHGLMPLMEQIKKRVQKKHLSIRLTIPDKIKSIEIDTDRVRLQQIIINLVTNAIKFTAEGSITLSVMKEGNNFLFSVTDTGPGISSEQQQIIFDRFRQVDDSGTRKYTGSGLGLAICKNLVRLLGGEIGLKSVPGEGSCFYFTIPMTDK